MYEAPETLQRQVLEESGLLEDGLELLLSLEEVLTDYKRLRAEQKKQKGEARTAANKHHGR